MSLRIASACAGGDIEDDPGTCNVQGVDEPLTYLGRGKKGGHGGHSHIVNVANWCSVLSSVICLSLVNCETYCPPKGKAISMDA